MSNEQENAHFYHELYILLFTTFLQHFGGWNFDWYILCCVVDIKLLCGQYLLKPNWQLWRMINCNIKGKGLVKVCETCHYFVCSYSSGTAEGKLEDRCCCSSKEVLPVDGINVGGIWVSSGWVLLSLLSAMVGIVQFDKKSFDSLSSPFNVD